MKKIALLIFSIALINCAGLQDLEEANVTIEFTHNWDGDIVDTSTFGNFNYRTANGETVSIDRLRYVVSQLQFVGNAGVNFSPKTYQLVDVGNGSGLSLMIQDLIPGTYEIRFRFGFSNADNQDGVYQDLNSVSFNVPNLLGGGYHYMQMDGKYKDIKKNDLNYNFHVIRAANTSNVSSPQLVDTSFEVNLGSVTINTDATVEIQMNVAEWFKNPNQWDLNSLDTNLMSNFSAQLQMSENGKSVFSLGTVTQ